MFDGHAYSGKELEFLANAGLTVTETRVYLTLIKIGPSQIRLISKEAGIQRPNLYKILDSLSNKGLIEKEIDSPIRYKATTPVDAVSMLIEQKKSQFLELRKTGKRVAKILERQSKSYVYKEISSNNRFVIIPGRNVIVTRLRMTLHNTQTSLEVVTAKNRFSSAVIAFAGDYEDALKRGIKILIVTEDHQPMKEACIVIKKLSKVPNFRLRFLPPNAPVDAITSIFDEKESYTTFSASADLNDSSALWSNNPSFISVMHNYFESKWKMGLPKSV